MRTEPWHARSSSRRAAPAATSSPGIAVADELRAARRRDARRLRGHAARPGVAARAARRLRAGAAAHPAAQRRRPRRARSRGCWPCPGRSLRAARARAARCGRRAVLGVGGYAGGPVVLVAALMRRAHGDPGAERASPASPTACCGRSCAARPARTRRRARAFGAQGRAHRQPGARRLRGAARARRTRAPLTLLVFGGSQGSRVAEPRAGGGAAAPARARRACASSTRRARPCATRSRPPTRAAGRAARGGARSSTTWRRASAHADLVVCAQRRHHLRGADGGGQGGRARPVRAGRRRPPARQRARARGRRAPRAWSRRRTSRASRWPRRDRASSLDDARARSRRWRTASRRAGRPDAAARVADLLEAGCARA